MNESALSRPAPPAHAAWLAALRWEELPEEVRRQACRCLRDTIATAAGSVALPASAQACILTESQFGPGPCSLWFRGRSSTLAGACFYNALAIDALDAHDGFRPNKGHAGATVTPVAVGCCAGRSARGIDLLTAVVAGYEVACRAGLVVHHHYAPAYHSSGSWASLGAAAAGAVLARLPMDRFDEVLGAAEYYGPMSPIPRCIHSPGILKDGAGAGAWSAAMALAMLQAGLAGLPSLFTAEPQGRVLAGTLGADWLILRQYFKAYPTCRWTQPVVEAAFLLQRQMGFSVSEVEAIEVETFREGAALTAFPPRDSDAAQYSTPWAVAAALVDGQLGVAQIHPDRLSDAAILALGRRVRTRVAPDLQARFPEECLARVTIEFRGGRRGSSPTMRARGDWDDPLSDAELEAKFHQLAEPTLGVRRAREIHSVLETLEERPAQHLLDLLQ
ncbi:MAG: MmgE/PrpD family protein [Planctomycetes bacterium]|nr:MmgE/PrpD family protein [Planctomycetota bacterium]